MRHPPQIQLTLGFNHAIWSFAVQCAIVSTWFNLGVGGANLGGAYVSGVSVLGAGMRFWYWVVCAGTGWRV